MKAIVYERILIRLLLVLLIIGTSEAVFAQPNIRVEVNGKYLETSVSPIRINGRILVPMRDIFEALGASVEWESSTSSITAHHSGKTVQMRIGSRETLINGQRLLLDQPAIIYNGNTLVPLRFVAEALGAQVEWMPYPPTISIAYARDESYNESVQPEQNQPNPPIVIPQPREESIAAERLISKGSLQPVRRVKINATEYTSVYMRPEGFDASDIDFRLEREWDWFEAELAIADNSDSKYMDVWGIINDERRPVGRTTVYRFKDPVTFRVRVADAVVFHLIARGDRDLIIINPRFIRQR